MIRSESRRLVAVFALLGVWICLDVLAGTGESGASKPGRRFKLPKKMVNLARPLAPLKPDPPEVAIGERLSLEFRFSHYFFEQSKGDANYELPAGDPSLDWTVTTTTNVIGSYAGLAMSCRTCHLVSETAALGIGNRSYADFAPRSPIPRRPDGRTVTARNTPPMVNASIPRETQVYLHFDGEFETPADLVKDTFTGRNFGWLPTEQKIAVAHVAKIIRDDDGTGALAREFGGSYRRVLTGTDSDLPSGFRLPPAYRLNVDEASDEQVLNTIASLVDAYLESLFFSRDEFGEYDASPYDAFLETNRFPRMPEDGQAELYYSRHLLSTIEGEPELKFIHPDPPFRFQLLRQPFQFGAEELAGLKIFFTLGNAQNARQTGGVGNCIACHRAPHFTDFRFHNTGATQEEYDQVHGAGAFARLEIPDLDARTANYDRYLPPTSLHPHALGRFLDLPARDHPERTDLGLWNIFANPDYARSQKALRTLWTSKPVLPDSVLLPRTIALFKTPSLRGLALSDPYLHTGNKRTLEEVVQFYRRMSKLAAAGQLRNADPALLAMHLSEADVAPLAAFLRSLNEDYE